MLDFHREDELLRELVGADSRQILSTASVSWADRFYLALERMAELASDPTPEHVLERDRLASFFGCAFGADGLLSRAGLMLALRDRSQRLVVLTPRLVADLPSLFRLRRDAVVTRALARNRLGTPAQTSTERAVLETVHAATSAAISCADFVNAAASLSAEATEGFFSPRIAHALADLGPFVADTSPQEPVMAIAAFGLAQWAHHKEERAIGGVYDALIDAHLTSLRDTLWATAEADAAKAGPLGLVALERLDRDLETILGQLTDRRLPSALRARVLAQLFALCAAGRALQAQQAANTALGETLGILGEGLAAETGGGT